MATGMLPNREYYAMSRLREQPVDR
jgi:hypothetical protein